MRYYRNKTWQILLKKQPFTESTETLTTLFNTCVYKQTSKNRKTNMKQQQNNLFVYCIKTWTNTHSNN